ncbi:phage tail tube protein [Paraburkholderia susongensis]|uniref:Phage tail tube protein n=1 Tax=Paraburkholderia susongensis TaxID=1515439 RepID=A0A1X7I5T6_9BURK|nr:phage tail tube protein [Paraburkholderia susongensis]SMG09459.1 Phage tail tube protein [Paraburkholderia susongensis]
MGQKVAGTCYVKAAGRQLEITGAVECPLADKERETIKRGFYSEKDAIPYVEVDALVDANFPRAALMNDTNQTVTVEFENTHVYVLSGAYMVGERPVTGDDAKAPLRWEGVRGDWL